MVGFGFDLIATVLSFGTAVLAALFLGWRVEGGHPKCGRCAIRTLAAGWGDVDHAGAVAWVRP